MCVESGGLTFGGRRRELVRKLESDTEVASGVWGAF